MGASGRDVLPLRKENSKPNNTKAQLDSRAEGLLGHLRLEAIVGHSGEPGVGLGRAATAKAGDVGLTLGRRQGGKDALKGGVLRLHERDRERLLPQAIRQVVRVISRSLIGEGGVVALDHLGEVGLNRGGICDAVLAVLSATHEAQRQLQRARDRGDEGSVEGEERVAETKAGLRVLELRLAPGEVSHTISIQKVSK